MWSLLTEIWKVASTSVCPPVRWVRYWPVYFSRTRVRMKREAVGKALQRTEWVREQQGRAFVFYGLFRISPPAPGEPLGLFSALFHPALHLEGYCVGHTPGFLPELGQVQPAVRGRVRVDVHPRQLPPGAWADCRHPKTIACTGECSVPIFQT